MPLTYAINLLVTETPWYFLACVPLSGKERVKRGYVALVCVSLIALRVAAGYFFAAYTRDWVQWDNHFVDIHAVVSLTTFILMFKIHPAKIFYTFLLIFSFATTVNYLTVILLLPFVPDGVHPSQVPQCAPVAAVLLIPAVPYVYRIMNGLLRRAFDELSDKSILFLCVTPAMFYALLYVHSLVLINARGLSAFSISLIKLFILLAGFVAYLVNLRTVLDTANYERAKKAFAADRAALDRLNRMKTEFMRTISHETLTPLAFIMGFAELTAEDARRSNISGEWVENLDMIAAEANRMAGMMEEMKQIANAKEYPKDRVPVDLAAIIRQFAGLFTRVWEPSGTVLEISVEGGLPPVSGNGDELTQVVFNLLGNAGRHTKNGVVTIRAEYTGGLVRVTVADTGTGISPELLPRVFERGIHGDMGGSGYGLAISRDIITAYDGEIWAESDGENGTNVIFTLPPYEERSAAGG